MLNGIGLRRSIVPITWTLADFSVAVQHGFTVFPHERLQRIIAFQVAEKPYLRISALASPKSQAFSIFAPRGRIFLSAVNFAIPDSIR